MATEHDVLTVVCDDCGPVASTGTVQGALNARTRHEHAHDPEQLPPALRVAARAVTLRLSVEAAKARIGMWQASSAFDPAHNADQVLEEVRQLLEQATP